MTSRTSALVSSCWLLLAVGCPTTVPATDAGSTGDDAGVDAGSVSTDAGSIDGGSGSDGGSTTDSGATDPCAGGACDPCDTGLAVSDPEPTSAARAMGVCSGLVSAVWHLPDGTLPSGSAASAFALGHGILPAFGTAVTAREGERLLALSTGTARRPTDAGYQDVSGFDKGYTSGTPPGLPHEGAACPGVTTGQAHDGIALELTLDVPTGASGFRLLLKHHSVEFPAYLCAANNDVAALIVSPGPMGAPDGEVTRDPSGNALSVNSSFIDVCSCSGGPGPCLVGGRTFACSAGSGELAGSGFDGTPDSGAATRWLEARVPATAGTRITILLTLWDSGDGVLDSTMIVDGFRWITDAPASAETRVLPSS